MNRGAVALLVVLVALTTSGSADAAPNRVGAPYAQVADHCVRYLPGETGMAVSADGSLTVYVAAWTFADGAGGYHGLDYRAWGPHRVERRAAGTAGRWQGFSVPAVAEIRVCATGPGRGPIVA